MDNWKILESAFEIMSDLRDHHITDMNDLKEWLVELYWSLDDDESIYIYQGLKEALQVYYPEEDFSDLPEI